MVDTAGSHCRILLIDIVWAVVVSERDIKTAIASCLGSVDRLRRHEVVKIPAARLYTRKLVCKRSAAIDDAAEAIDARVNLATLWQRLIRVGGRVPDVARL